MGKEKTGINYGVVQLMLLGLVVLYGVALLCGITVPDHNKEAFAGVWAVILTLLNVDTLRAAIAGATAITLRPLQNTAYQGEEIPPIPEAEKPLPASAPAPAAAIAEQQASLAARDTEEDAEPVPAAPAAPIAPARDL